MLKCIICNIPLTGLQKRFCSTRCKGRHVPNKNNDYQAQKKRGIERKKLLLEMAGGKCSSCGYSKNMACLVFHHISQEDKKFQLDMRNLSNRKWETILKEFEKCSLMCHNCHTEYHNPDYALTN